MNIENDLPPSGFVAAAFVAPNRFARAIVVSVIGLCVAQCMPETKLASVVPEVVTQTFNKSEPESLPKGVGYNKTGKPYTVAGKLYVPREEKGYSATGLASWYGTSFHGRETANGEVFDRKTCINDMRNHSIWEQEIISYGCCIETDRSANVNSNWRTSVPYFSA
jgi:hypothetical protein